MRKSKFLLLHLIAVIFFAVTVASAYDDATSGGPVTGMPKEQTLLPGANIPKFIDPLPEIGKGITAVDATRDYYNIYMMEFPAHVLPNAPIPLPNGGTLPAGIKTDVWGYRTDTDKLEWNRQTYIGPVVVAKKRRSR